MIISQEFETLTDAKGVSKINLKDLINQSKDISENWKEYMIDNSDRTNFMIDDTMKFVYNPITGDTRRVDISEFAFGQLCTRLGVPSSYIKKCFDGNKADLAIENFQAWSGEMKKNILVRENQGIARAVLSDSYKSFDSYKILKTLNNTVDSSIYQPSQAFLSEDRLHIRFVNYDPLPIDDDELYSGFTVDSSDVGRGSLNMKFFLYRTVCKNGMVISSFGGTLFKQNHIGGNMTGGKLELFNRALIDIDTLSSNAVNLVKNNKSRFLKDYELEMYLEKARRELHLSEKSQEKLQCLIDNTYNRSKWGFLNSITELSQEFTLDTRIEFETWAGDIFSKAA